MTKNEFLAQLEYRLRVLPENERRDAVEYYEGYIDDAAEDEASAIEHLGPPAEVAAKIIAEIAVGGSGPYAEGGRDSSGAYAEGGRNGSGPYAEGGRDGSGAYAGSGGEGADAGSRAYPGAESRAYAGGGSRAYAGNGGRAREPEPAKGQGRRSGLPMAWTVILAIFAVPIGLPLAVAAASVAFAMLAVVLSLLAAFGATAFGLVVGGAASVIVGIVALFSNPLLAMMILGAALAVLGFGVLFAKLTAVLAESGFRAVAKFAGKFIIRRGKNV